MDLTWYDELEARIPTGTVRTRFAPSPTGYMHVGNLRTALYTWLIARKAGGKFIFRLEDTDQTRQVEGATELIYRTLQECGLTHDEGPDVGGPVGPYIQTQRRGLYGKYAQLLVEKATPITASATRPRPKRRALPSRRKRTPAATSPRRRSRPIWTPASPTSSAKRFPRMGAPPSPTSPSGRSPWRTAPWTTRSC